MAIVAAIRSSTGLAVILPRNDLREVPIATGRPSATSSSRRRSSSRLCSVVLPNPIPGSSTIRSSAIAVRDGELQPLLEERLDLGRRRRRSAGRAASCAARRACASGSSRRSAAATTSAIVGSPRSAVTSLTSVAPAAIAAAGDRRLRGVDRDLAPASRPRSAPRSPAARGAAPRPRGTGLAPGRVDSPPTSRIAAPSRSSSSAWSIAASRVEVQAAVGERVGGHVDDPHDARIRRRPPPRPRCASRLLVGPVAVDGRRTRAPLLLVAVAVALDAHPEHPVDHPHDQRRRSAARRRRPPRACGCWLWSETLAWPSTISTTPAAAIPSGSQTRVAASRIRPDVVGGVRAWLHPLIETLPPPLATAALAATRASADRRCGN